MKRVLLDTNIYGLLSVDKEFHALHILLENQKKLRIYGLDVIRKELKDAPRIIIGGVNIRASLLRAYSSLICKEYPVEDRFLELARSYHEHYKALGGSLSWEKLANDLLIIACASVKDISIVVSEDNATMLNELQRRAYELVNKKEGVGLPIFIGYDTFKKNLRTCLSDPFIDNPNKLRVLLCLLNIFPVIFLLHSLVQVNLIYKDYVTLRLVMA